jgi:hypothetical protein
MLIEKIKNIVVQMIHYSDQPPTFNFSAYLADKLNYDYNYLSNLFSEVKAPQSNTLSLPIKLKGLKSY